MRYLPWAALLLASLSLSVRAQQPDLLFADFEGPTYGDWTAAGKAFGDGPAAGTLPRQMQVSGFKGKRLVNSFYGGDGPTGTLTSPPFKIDRKYISFLVGGGGFEGKTCINLLVDDKVVRTATGPNTRPGGHELLDEAQWDVSDLAGKTARIQIVDNASGGWGHILVDHIVFTDKKAAIPQLQNNPARQILADRKLLNLPVKNGAKMRKAKVSVDGQEVREFTIECADDAPDWWATLDVSAWRGKTLTLQVDKLPEGSKFLSLIEPGDARKGIEDLYREPLRPQIHFTQARGWNNDPNGMVFFNGEYHLFFQHNPYGVKWGNMHWGHAVSKDLVHWQELDIALYPDPMGTMFSGSGVVDWRNTSGLGAQGKSSMILIYTAAGQPYTQGIAASTDGRTFTKYAGNPVVPHISGGNRDPKVLWHEPTKQWVMALYVDFPEPAQPGEKKKKGRQTIHFLTSSNLRDWTDASEIEGFHECPDLFALPVDGEAKNTKWVLTAANSDYMVGSFDGKKFTPDSPVKIKGQLGRGFYAAQTFSDLPASDGRRIQVGWFQTPSPGMPFNQSMTVPLELKLLSTPEGPRLAWSPVKELESLRASSKRLGPVELKPDAPITQEGGELLDVRMEFEPGQTGEVELNVRGVAIRYDARTQELAVNDHKAPAPLRSGKQKLIVLADRNSFEIFASDGLTYVPFPVIAKSEDRTVSVVAKGAPARITSLEVHPLKSIWENPAR